MKKIFVLFCIVSISLKLYAANENYLFGGRQAGMGNAAITLFDLWAVSHNQAGLARIDNITAGVYAENRYLIPDLTLGAGALAVPAAGGVFGLSFTHFGYSLYNENKVGLAYSRMFGERFSAGVQLNYHHLSIGEDYGSKSSVTVEMGVIYELIENLHIGFHLFNPTRTKIADYDGERIPTIMRGGFSYTFSDRVIFIFETEKDINLEAVYKAGLEYRVIDPIYLRVGVGTNPMSNSFGFGLEFSNFQLDLSSSYHHILGYSPQFSLIYQFK
ncbi:MAG: hypothetical protein KGZ97_11185 [Bacteroidetes bacterium]|nr:hypothetical protein [Bacteroidota bacterium]